MNLKERVVAVAAVGAMAAALLYGGTLELREPTEEVNPLSWFSQKETIYFWYSDETMSNFINSAAVSFGEKEGVRVIPVLTSDSEYLEALNQASLTGEQVPDAYVVSHNSLEKAYLAGLATEIQDAEDACGEANFPKAALSAISYEGKEIAYPLSYETSALVYNDTYLTEWAAQVAQRELLNAGEEDPTPESQGIPVDEAVLEQKTAECYEKAIPATVDDILYVADTFDVPEGVEGVFKWDVSDIFYNYWVVGNYINVGGEAGDDSTLISIDNQEAIQCLEVYKALNQFFSIESDTVAYDAVLQDFAAGKTIYTIATSDAVARFKEAKEKGQITFEYGFATMPEVSEELRSRSMSVTHAVAVNGYSEHKELANRFAAYLTCECADKLYEMTGKPSANLHVNLDNQELQIFMAEYADSIPLTKMMETENFWIQLERLFASVWNGADVTALVQELSGQIASQLSDID